MTIRKNGIIVVKKREDSTINKSLSYFGSNAQRFLSQLNKLSTNKDNDDNNDDSCTTSMKTLRLFLDFRGTPFTTRRDIVQSVNDFLESSDELEGFQIICQSIHAQQLVNILHALQNNNINSNKLKTVTIDCSNLISKKSPRILLDGKTGTTEEAEEENSMGSANNSLQEIHVILKGCDRRSSDIIFSSIAKSLPSFQNLQTLTIHCDGIGYTGEVAMAEYFRQNSTLRTIQIHCHHHSIRKCELFATSFLLQPTSLKNLTLTNTQLRLHGVQAIAGFLAFQSCPLQVLNLERNHIDGDGAQALTSALQYNTNLRELNLSNNYIGNTGCIHIASLLRFHQINNDKKDVFRLKSLNLSFNSVQFSGIDKLAQALSNNIPLQKLYFDYNDNTQAGHTVMAKALETNHNLQIFSMKTSFSRYQSPNVYQLFATTLEKHNHSLQQIHLEPNDIDDDYTFHPARAYKRQVNRQLQLNKERPIQAEIIKTQTFPLRLFAANTNIRMRANGDDDDNDDDVTNNNNNNTCADFSICFAEAIVAMNRMNKLKNILYTFIQPQPDIFESIGSLSLL